MSTHVLVVEDSPTQAEALRGVLEAHGYTVTAAATGEEALALVPGGGFDIVISDIVMPGISGYDVCRRIKTDLRRRDLPVILLTSLTDPTDIVRGLECGADNFLTKPYQPEHLLDRVTHVLMNRKMHATARIEVGVTLNFLGKTFTISSDREQVLDLLVSTYEDAVLKNRELQHRERELEAAKAELARYAGTLEQRLETVLASVPDVLYSVDPSLGQRYYISPACEHVLGLSPEELIAQPGLWIELVAREEQPAVRAWVERVVKSQRPEHLEYRIRHRDGTVRWIEDTLVPAIDEAGTVRRLDGIARDITDQRKLEEQFRQAHKMEAVGRLAGGIAHDFNNLLTVVINYTDILLEDLPPDDRRRGDLEEIRKAATGAAGLTRQLLAFSRQQLLEPRVLDLNAVWTNVENLLRRLLGEDIEISAVLTPRLGAVKADPGQLEQVIMNLAVNARDAMPDGGKLTIETTNIEIDEAYVREHALARSGRYVMLAVSDNGVGMDEETQRRIFEPFFTTKEVGKGTGLGLATVYGIVNQSGGFVWVYSEPGHGTTFKIYLPRVDESIDHLAGPGARVEPPHGTETVLLVEDTAAVRAVARQLLDRLGYTVLEAPNGQTALRLASTHHGPIHLLLTDVIMPGLGGRQLAEQLRAWRPELRVLYVSGYTDDAVVRNGVLGSGVARLQKPFTSESLARKVREVLDAPEGPDAS
ncbi:MAG: response regulator [Gemmatimonadales bacterium]